LTKPKQKRKPRQVRSLRDLSGGINYASNVLAEEGRARLARIERLIEIVKAYLGTAARVTDAQAVTDLLADLRHYCDCKGLEFSSLDEAAIERYDDENTDQRDWPSPFRELKQAAYRQGS
jgi:hypothetical protein